MTSSTIIPSRTRTNLILVLNYTFTTPFDTMTPAQKLSALDAIFDDLYRESLALSIETNTLRQHGNLS